MNWINDGPLYCISQSKADEKVSLFLCHPVLWHAIHNTTVMYGKIRMNIKYTVKITVSTKMKSDSYLLN